MHRRVIALVLAVFLLVVATPAQAAAPAGPRLAISLSGDGPGAEDEFSEVITTGPAGEDPQRLFGGVGAMIGDGLSWSADGGRIAISAVGVESTADGPFGTGWPVVGLVKPDSGDAIAYPRAFLNGGEPVLAPDGRTVAFSRLKLVKTLPGRENYLFKTAIWSLNADRGSVGRLTRWRLASFVNPISFSADGSSIVAELLDRKGLRIVAIDRGTRRSSRLARLPGDAREPTYSPDGTKLAYVRERDMNANRIPARPISELLVARADGSEPRRLLRAKGYISHPSWDPSGSRLAFTRDPAAEATGALEPEPGNKVMAINADGTCLTRVFTDAALTLYDVAWWPGPGREAGPIAC